MLTRLRNVQFLIFQAYDLISTVSIGPHFDKKKKKMYAEMHNSKELYGTFIRTFIMQN